MMCGLAMLFFGCEPTTPPNNALKKGHEDPVKAEIVFTPGELSQENIQDNVYAKGFTPMPDVTPEIFTMNVKIGKGEATSPGIKLKPGVWYKVDVKFYNRAGENIVYQFTDSKAARSIHQFFFQPRATDEITKILNDVIDYRYGDLDKDGNLYPTPIGFQGYLRIASETQLKAFNLWVVLVHLSGNLVKEMCNGNACPFDKPSLYILRRSDRDNDFTIPVDIVR